MRVVLHSTLLYMCWSSVYVEVDVNFNCIYVFHIVYFWEDEIKNSYPGKLCVTNKLLVIISSINILPDVEM